MSIVLPNAELAGAEVAVIVTAICSHPCRRRVVDERFLRRQLVCP